MLVSVWRRIPLPAQTVSALCWMSQLQILILLNSTREGYKERRRKPTFRGSLPSLFHTLFRFCHHDYSVRGFTPSRMGKLRHREAQVPCPKSQSQSRAKLGGQVLSPCMTRVIWSNGNQMFLLEGLQRHPKSQPLSFFLFFLIYSLASLSGMRAGSQFPNQGSNPHPLHWKCSLNHWTAREVPTVPFLRGLRHNLKDRGSNLT